MKASLCIGMSAGLVESTVSFCRALRDRGLPVTTSHAFDAVRALRSVGLSTRPGTYHALKCVLASRPEDFEIFDQLFEEMFAAPRHAGPSSTASWTTNRSPS